MRLLLITTTLLCACTDHETVNPRIHLGAPSGWSQWGGDASHAGRVAVTAEDPTRVISTAAVDPFVVDELLETSGDLLAHYQSPLLDGADVFIERKSGSYSACDPPGSGKPAPCGPDAWGDEIWSEMRLGWQGGSLVPVWTFESDWKPVPDRRGLGGWEPVFHAALAGEQVVVPGAGGTVFVVDRETGALAGRVNPFDDLRAERHTTGPLTVDPMGNVLYHVVELATEADPWNEDIAGAWLVRVAPSGAATKVAFSSLVPDAPQDGCRGAFGDDDALPWPPSPDSVPKEIPCGAQRPGINAAPAVGPDGTIYTVSRAHFARRYAYLVAVRPDLSPGWASSLRDRLEDGCGSAVMPPIGEPGGCRAGAKTGVDPATNAPPAGIVEDDSTASPTVAPDGSILYGAYSRYNGARGHLFRFSAAAEFQAAYDFGWDVTPAIHEHDGTYSIVIKDNRYEAGSYCNDEDFCPTAEEGPHRITQLSPDLAVEWSYTNDNPRSCARGPDGALECVEDHPHGFEWCINAPAVDARGVVYANAEDGVLYAIPQGGKDVASVFLGRSIGAAYTPLSIDASGRVYAQNLGQLFVVGE